MSPSHWTHGILLFCAISSVHATARTDSDYLISYLFNGYNQYVSPFVNRENATNIMDVSIRLSRVIVASVNEKDFTVSTLVTVNYQWIDPRFRWNVTDSGGIREIAVKSSAVWQPDVYPCESAGVTTVTPEAISALIRFDGKVILDVDQVVTYNCPMNFDAFPFDRQRCMISFALDGFTGSSVNLKDTPPDERQLRGNSEWDFVGNLSIDDFKTESDGLQTDTVTYHFLLARRPFFWVYLIVVPSCLLVIVALLGIFLSDATGIVENAVSIGLTTMTSLMLLVTILADSLAKTNNLSGLGWFVLMDIFLVCVSVVAILVIDHTRTFALEMTRKKRKENKYLGLLLSNNTYRATRVLLFVLAVVGLVLNVIINWTILKN